MCDVELLLLWVGILCVIFIALIVVEKIVGKM
jgi:hypothetical protein